MESKKKVEHRRSFIINIIYIAIILAVVYFALKYLTGVLLPFALGFAIAFLLKPVIEFCERRLKMKWGLSSVLVVTLFYCTIGVLITILIIRLVNWTTAVVVRIPSLYSDTVYPGIMSAFDTVSQKLQTLDPDVSETVISVVREALSSLGSALTGWSVSAVGVLSGVAKSIPGILLAAMITIIASYFVAVDYKNIRSFILRQLSEPAAKLVMEIRSDFAGIIGQFIRSYLLIMLITFAELFLGLSILQIDSSALIALLITVLDILPIVGTGTVLIPWSIICFIRGNISIGIGLAVLYIFITVVRQILEPKIVGDHVGIHPLITLIAMFVGTKLFGIWGLFGFPIACAIIKSLNDKGSIHLIK